MITLKPRTEFAFNYAIQNYLLNVKIKADLLVFHCHIKDEKLSFTEADIIATFPGNLVFETTDDIPLARWVINNNNLLTKTGNLEITNNNLSFTREVTNKTVLCVCIRVVTESERHFLEMEGISPFLYNKKCLIEITGASHE